MDKTLNRRNFFKNSFSGFLGAWLGHPIISKSSSGTDKSEPPKITEFRTLGRTEFKVSDISCGYVTVPEILDNLLDAGVNYIDTGETYRNEQMIGDIIKKRDRKKLFITTKLYFKEDEGKSKFLERTRKCMERLQTDYLDCMMIHESPSTDILKTKGFHEAMDELKAEGRLRFLGVSNHGVTYAENQKESMEKVLLAAAEDGRFDVFLLVYNFLQQKNGERVLSVCRERNIGTALMKVNPVKHYYWMKNDIETKEKEGKEISENDRQYFSRLEELMKRAESFTEEYHLQNPNEIRDAAIRFCLNNPAVNTICLEFSNFDLLNSYLGLSGTRLSSPEKKKLDVYTNIYGSLYCRHGCNVCEAECPHNVPINTIMRYNHYFEAHGREKRAMTKYEHLQSPKADICQNCVGRCDIACPFGVPVRGLLMLAHRNLSLA
jgi:predicted aldo/keto reductase-like oxidoreductase